MFLRMNCDNFWMLSDASLVNFLLLFRLFLETKRLILFHFVNKRAFSFSCGHGGVHIV